MANSNTEHSRKLRAATAAAHTKAKLASGEYKAIGLNGKSEDIEVILQAVAKAGGSRVQALRKICEYYLANA